MCLPNRNFSATTASSAKLGSGGMGEVYLAHDSTLERPVAIKLIAGSQTDTEGGRRRLLREAQAAAALDHPNICAVHEIRSEGGRSFIVMQFCDGETLAARLQRGPIPPDETDRPDHAGRRCARLRPPGGARAS